MANMNSGENRDSFIKFTISFQTDIAKFETILQFSLK